MRLKMHSMLFTIFKFRFVNFPVVQAPKMICNATLINCTPYITNGLYIIQKHPESETSKALRLTSTERQLCWPMNAKLTKEIGNSSRGACVENGQHDHDNHCTVPLAS
mmetsp:Transcript_8623/g.12855  ORF Transcript_8623/g.12855 Transcript_8623/m.12855 type:complete len:108 (+) Transcript_8623:80-403(+)